MTLMLPADVQVTAGAGGCTVAFEDRQTVAFGIQFELERNDPDGSTILKNFARDICGCMPWFTMDAALAEARRALTEASIEGGFAVCGVSGGVDSMVAAVLAHQAFGERMTAIYVETGLMRAGEGAAVQETFTNSWGFRFAWPIARKACLPDFAGRQTMREKARGRRCLPARRDDPADGGDSRRKDVGHGHQLQRLSGRHEQRGMEGLRHGGARTVGAALP